jgi:hypothetical protein
MGNNRPEIKGTDLLESEGRKLTGYLGRVTKLNRLFQIMAANKGIGLSGTTTCTHDVSAGTELAISRKDGQPAVAYIAKPNQPERQEAFDLTNPFRVTAIESKIAKPGLELLFSVERDGQFVWFKLDNLPKDYDPLQEYDIVPVLAESQG